MTEPARTLAIDVGGSGFKAAVLDSVGEMLTERVRIDTPYPCPPATFLAGIAQLTSLIDVEYDRVSVGFPGLIRGGAVRMVPSLSRLSYGGENDPDLEQQWHGYPLVDALTKAFDQPVKVANDADVQGCAVVSGVGLELVITLGTGCGTALFNNGALLPHLEMGHAPFRKGETFEDQLGNAARKDVGNARWSERVLKAIEAFDSFLFFDHLYLGGGNAKHLAEVPLPANTSIVPNTAGILGGIKIWELDQAD